MSKKMSKITLNHIKSYKPYKNISIYNYYNIEDERIYVLIQKRENDKSLVSEKMRKCDILKCSG